MSPPNNILSFGDIQVNPMTGFTYVSGKPVSITMTDYQVLLLLLHNSGSVVESYDIMDLIGDTTSREYLWVSVNRLRKKLKSSRVKIKAVPNEGYRLALKEEDDEKEKRKAVFPGSDS